MARPGLAWAGFRRALWPARGGRRAGRGGADRRDFAIVHFGSHDKTALISGIFVLLAIFAVVIGVLARRWLAAGLAGLTIFGALGVSAALTRPTAAASSIAPKRARSRAAAHIPPS